MRTELAAVLNDCLEKLASGATLEACLNANPQFAAELKPLLMTAQSISHLPVVNPSPEFITQSKERLLARIRHNAANKSSHPVRPGLLGLVAGLRQLSLSAFLSPRKLAIPVAASLILVLVVTLCGVVTFSSPGPVLASQSTLSILSGNVTVLAPGSAVSQEGHDGMTLTAGTRVTTGADSYVLLTFFEGSTITLTPDTELEVEQIKSGADTPTTIVLKQWAGKTWSRVVRLADPGGRYEIDTPTASAVVRGTLFTTEVAPSGVTRVATTQGLVGVFGQGQEVPVAANQETIVSAQSTPSPAAPVPQPPSELVVTIDRPAVGSVTDPNGTSTGNLDDRVSFNQITGSQSELTGDVQQIRIPGPISGEYIISLRYLDTGDARFRIISQAQDITAVTYAGEWPAAKGSGWRIHLNLQVDNGRVSGLSINKVEPMNGRPVEKLVLTPPSSTTDSLTASPPPAPGQSTVTSSTSTTGADKKTTDESGKNTEPERGKDNNETNSSNRDKPTSSDDAGNGGKNRPADVVVSDTGTETRPPDKGSTGDTGPNTTPPPAGNDTGVSPGSGSPDTGNKDKKDQNNKPDVPPGQTDDKNTGKDKERPPVRPLDPDERTKKPESRNKTGK